MAKRVFLIVLDSVGIGALPDAGLFGDGDCNTLNSCFKTGRLKVPTMTQLGLFNIKGNSYGTAVDKPLGCFARMKERSMGKDTTIGHWEIAGVVSDKPLPTFPNGFPPELISEFEKAVGKKVLCNKPYSGTDVIRDYGDLSIRENALIVYTSADSVFQVAAHEDVVPLEELYRCCKIARKLLTGDCAVGRVIARPFVGEMPFKRSSGRHDFSLYPPRDTMLNALQNAGLDTLSVGKIYDIFAGSGLIDKNQTASNREGMEKTDELLKLDFNGLCFVNLVDFDMLYGHRNNVNGYTAALNEFDLWLSGFITRLKKHDLLLITADHGCDPTAPGTDHTREYTPLLAYGEGLKLGVNLGTRSCFGDIAASICEYLEVDAKLDGQSFLSKIRL